MKPVRILLLVLAVLNLGYFAWTQGGLAMFGAVPASQSEREPQRMAQQIRPAALQIRKESDLVAPAPASGASSSEQAPSAGSAAPTAQTPPTAPPASSADHEGL